MVNFTAEYGQIISTKENGILDVSRQCTFIAAVRKDNGVTNGEVKRTAEAKKVMLLDPIA